jgi:hypothetical protein
MERRIPGISMVPARCAARHAARARVWTIEEGDFMV